MESSRARTVNMSKCLPTKDYTTLLLRTRKNCSERIKARAFIIEYSLGIGLISGQYILYDYICLCVSCDSAPPGVPGRRGHGRGAGAPVLAGVYTRPAFTGSWRVHVMGDSGT